MLLDVGRGLSATARRNAGGRRQRASRR